MREIKFRAFDIGTKEMIYPMKEDELNPICIQLNGMIMQLQDEDLINDTAKPARRFPILGQPILRKHKGKWSEEITTWGLVLMQYIGLKCKNGKEIYEGDIIEVTETAGMLEAELSGVKALESWVYRGVVEYDVEGADFQINPGKEDDIRGFTTDQIREVIGNIYENPELLK